MIRHSYSRLSTYIRCPLSYKLQYLDKLPAEKGNPAILGGLCHDFFEAYDRHLAAARLPTDHGAAPRIMEEVFQRFERPVPPTIYEEYHEICRAFVQSHMLDLAAYVGSEVEIAITRSLTLCGWNDDDAWFRFKLDRLDKAGERAIITDYKTGWGGEADPFQLLLYACAVWIKNMYEPILPETGELRVVEVVLSYNRSGRENQWIFTQEKIEAGMRKMVEYADRVEREQAWKPTPGAACKGCSFAGTKHCQVKVADLGALATPADAARAANELLLLEAQAKARKAAIKDWVRVHGPLPARDNVFDFSSREKYEVINPLCFVKALEQAGYSPVDFYEIATTELKRRCQRDPQLADLISPFIAVESSETFGHRAAPKRDPFAAPHQGGTHDPQKTLESSRPPAAARPRGAGARPAPAARPGLARFGGADDRAGDRSEPGTSGAGPDDGGHRRRGPARRAGPEGAGLVEGPGDQLGSGPGGGRRRPF